MNAIPHCIHHIWLGSPLPAHLASMVDTWRTLHPGWDHRLWTDTDIDGLGLRHQWWYDHAADIVQGGSHAVWQYRADLARYEILQHYGGVYADTDTTCQKPLTGLVDARPGNLIAAWEIQGKWIGNTVLAAPPGHSAIAAILNGLPVHLNETAPAPANKLAGPQYLTPVLRGRDDVAVLDSGAFYPVPWNEPERSDTEAHPGAYVVHHWQHQRTIRGLPMNTTTATGPDLGALDALTGLITDDVGRELYDQATRVHPGTAIVEIGSYHGKSTAYLAAGAADGVQVWAVDPWSESVSAWRRAVADRIPSPEFDQWERQLASVGLRDRVHPVRSVSTDAARAYDGDPIGLLYVDGDHSERAAWADLDAWAPHLAPEAVVIYDDYNTRGNPGVTKAIHAMHARRRLRGRYTARDRLAVGTYAHPDRKPVRLSASIMAHPDRAAQVDELTASLDRDVPVSWDTGGAPSPDPRRRWATGSAAWGMHDPDADWHLVLQDDAIACPDLLSGLEAALDHIGPDGLVSAYTGTGRPQQQNVRLAIRDAERRGRSWLSTWSLNWGVAICAPVRTIAPMLEWCSDAAREDVNYDMRIGRYYRDVLGWRTWYTHPSLVDHRDAASLIGHGAGGNRVAHRHTTGSALDVDWGAHAGLPIDVPAKARRSTTPKRHRHR